MTPYDSAGMFFNKLKSFDYRSMDPGAAAQKVQVSAFPSRYGQQMGAAEKLLASAGVFDKGGLARGIGFLPKAVIKPERVLSPEMTPLFDRFIGFLPKFMETVDTARAEMRIAAAGGDAGYGALAQLFGDEVGRVLVDEADWFGTAMQEVGAAWQGEDFGSGATERYLGSRGANTLLNAAGAGRRAEQVIQFNVDPDAMIRAGDIADMIDQRLDGARAEFMTRRPAMAVTTRGKAF